MKLWQGRPQATEQERHQPLRQASGQRGVARIIGALACEIAQFTAGDDLQHIGSGDRVRHGAKHEMQAPDNLRFGNIRQGTK
ncbi:MAG: hypothetical protein AW09_002932 [Candidatus Accumulibacter phosphatis]|uniref:Uncharacterized protein n=1 Tax=Candidatus Accumulibacter phosphatis TaxID=327160 RepID=A0A080M495_9PROT|nr:MAG: hypothetical protein AW09_002932 [Candidatus Accumulibacter phosphatis]